MHSGGDGGGNHGNCNHNEADGRAAEEAAGEAEAPERSGGAVVEGGFEDGEVGADGGEGVGVGDGVWEGVEGLEEVEGANAVVLGGVGRVQALEEIEERRVKGTRAKEAAV